MFHDTSINDKSKKTTTHETNDNHGTENIHDSIYI